MMNKSIKALCLAGLSFLSFSFAQSQISSNLSFSLTSGPFLPVDANSCGVDLPTAYLVGVKAVNSGSTEINVGTLTLDSLPNSGWSVIGPLNAEVKIGKLAANQERTAFYYVRANCSDKGNLVGLRLTANNGSNTQYFRTSLTVEGIISANSAGSITSNYANLDVIGSTIYDTITFSFSGFKSGNHHLMNPSSLVTFKATLLELQECEVLSVSHTGLGIAAGDINKTYFKAGFNAQGSTNYTVTQVFKWKVVDFGDSTLLVPMSANQQGGTNVKGLVADSSWGSTGKPVVISSSANTISLTKSVSPSRYSQGDTLTYSLKVSNSSSLADVAIDYINDTLPSGLTFIGIDQTGDVDSVDLSSIPTLSSTGNIRFIGGSQDATTGDISIQVPKSSSVTLKYKVKAGTTATGDLINKAGVFVGSRALDTARVTISEYGAPALDTLKTVAITCNGGSDGEVHLTANDAPRPFTWSKDGTNYQSDSSFKNLTSGSYTFYAKSNSGKISTINVTLTNPNALSISGGNSVCDGSDITLTGSGTAATTNAWVSATTSVATITSAGVLTGVSSGTSVITYTDNNGCTVTETVTVNALPTVAVSPTSASITSGNSQSLTASGATSYSWSPSTGLSATTGGTVTASPTTTTTYTVTGTDANGCVNTASSTITVGSSLTAGAIAGNTTICSGGDPAAFTSSSSASGGTGSYTYEWESSTNSGSTWSAISSSNSTTYDVPSGLTQTTQYRRKVSDGSNTTYSNSLTVTVNDNPSSSGVSVTNVSCNGGTDGSADITVTGGTSPYTYAWSGPSSYSSTSEDINTLSAGTYSVTVTDANSCTSSNTSVVVTEPTALTLSNGSQTNVDCNGNSTGSVTVSAAGGTSPYEYKIGTGSYGTSATFSSLSAGSYTVTAKDANGCTQTLSVTITEPAAALSSSGVSVTNVSCNGGTDGSADITVTGGTSPYTYAWSGPSSYSSTSEDINTLSAGTYSVTVTDANSCTSSNTSVVVTEPTALTLSNGSQTNVDCNGNSTGSVTVSAAGGTSPYEYKIGTGSYGTSATFSSLSAGSYTVTAKDANGCTQTLSVTITEPAAALSSSGVSVTNVSCNGGTDGSADITVTGGTSPYTYAWSGPSSYSSTSEDINTLSAGTYSVTVTDANSCTSSNTSVVVTEPTALTLSNGSQTNVDCNGNSTGSVTVSAAGGTSPYEYKIGTGSYGTSATFSSLSAGSYTVTAKDANGCTQTLSVTITEPAAALSSSGVSVTNVSCNGGTDGSADITVTGGTSPYTYAWSGPSSYSSTSEDINTLSAGTYSVTVTDANSCTSSNTSVVVTEPTALTLSNGSQTNVDCNGNSTGSVTVSAAGGTSPYEYKIGTGSYGTSATFSSLSAGSYTVTAKDANGCTQTLSVTITEPAAALSSSGVSVTNVSCNGGTDGSADITVTGGTSPYTYAWSGPSSYSSTSEDINTLSAGTYSVTVTDANSCTSSNTSVVVTEPTALTLSNGSQTNVDCNGNSTGSVTVSAAGGTSPYEYKIGTGSYGTSATFSSLSAGSYTVTAKDANGCTQTLSVTITEPAAALSSSGVSVTNVSCNGGTDGSADITVTGGTSPYTYAWSGPSSYSSTSEDINTLSAGTYSVTVTDANSCTSSNTSVVVTEPTALTLSNGSQTNVDCNGNSTGSVTVSAAGGTSPYEYKIGTGSYGTSATFSSLSAGSYTVTAKDANGCTQTLSVTITEPAAISVSSISSTNVTCNGARDGTITITATGGGTLKYSIDNGSTYQSSNVFSALAPGSYTVVVSDNNNCNASYTPSQSVTITQPGILTLGSIVPTDPSCLSASDGKIVLNVTGGNTISYSIDSGATFQNSNTFTGLSIGIYKAVIKDNLGCTPTYSNSQYVTLVNGDQTNPIAVVKNASVNLNASGSASISYSDIENGSSDNCGVTKIYLDDSTFNCSDAGVNKVILTVEDAAGNQDTAHAYVTVSDAINPVAVVKNASVNLNASGSASISYSDIENGSSDNCGVTKIYLDDSTFNCSDAGVNKVILTVEDAAGNQDTAHAYVTVSDAINPVAVVKNASVNLNASGSASISYSDIENGSSDNCGVTKIYLDDSTFNCSDAGVNKVILTVEDAAGNQDTAHAYVTVSDAINPVVIGNNLVIYLDSFGSASITNEMAVQSATDNCSVKDTLLDKFTFDCSDTGKVNEVVITVSDDANNSHKDTIDVIVYDKISPVIRAKDITLYLDNNGKVYFGTNDIDTGSFDNCSIKSREVNIDSFDCGNLGNNAVVYTVEDHSGNVSTKNITITVLDTIKPIVTVKTNIVYLDTAAKGSIVNASVISSTYDNCGILDSTVSQYNFTIADTGWVDLDVYVTDVNGNKTGPVRTKVLVLFADSDNDSIPDYIEGPEDTDGDGVYDYLDLDSDNDGILDVVENEGKDFLVDFDSDGKPNYKDLDADNDGIDDVIEADGDDPDFDGIAGNGVADVDLNGVPRIANGGYSTANTDNAEKADFLDEDADNDGIPDNIEKGPTKDPIDTDNDGLRDWRSLDSDGDGIPDEVEKGSDGNNPIDTDGDGTPDYRDLDSDNDGIPDEVEKGSDGNNPIDTDGDGTPDYRDLDSDNDGIPDEVEKGSDGNNPIDTDGDGTPDYRDLDSDNDGIPDEVEKGSDGNNPIDTDGDGTPDYRDLDSDNDGIPDEVEKGSDGNNPVDTDGDGTPDYRDLDSDNDGIPDEVEKGSDGNNPVDTDGDGTPDYRDLDSDNDGIPDEVEKGSDGNNPIDTDGDGTPDYRDLDSDNDGIPDEVEKGSDGNNPVDTDGDGTPDYRDLDSDNDGIPDEVEKGSDGNNPIDTDGDGTPDYRDLDSDNDGIPDEVEKGSDGNNPIDTDGDGTPDYRELDSDDDGIPDSIEAGDDGKKPVDTDGDGTPDYRDLDSDNDGLSDEEEAGDDGDNPEDSDGDGIPDFRELDADDDGVKDADEFEGDCDGDGIPNNRDSDPCEPIIPNGFSPNGDGVNDNFQIPGIEAYKNNKVIIYNRWGNVVYQASRYQNQWDGTSNTGIRVLDTDGKVPDGTYFYFVDLGDGSKPRSGSLYINRVKKY